MTDIKNKLKRLTIFKMKYAYYIKHSSNILNIILTSSLQN